MQSRTSAPPRVAAGSARLFYAFDVGSAIDLEAAQRALAGEAALERIRHKGHAPRHAQFDPPPLLVLRDMPALEVAGFRTLPQVEVTLWDFGGVAVAFEASIAGLDLEQLAAGATRLASDSTAQDAARALVERLVAALRPCIDHPSLAEQEEDYVAWEVRSFEGDLAPEELLARHERVLARILRAEPDELSEQEVREAVETVVRFGTRDLAIVDWNGAFLLDPEPADTLAVLEFANLELLELRFLDDRLDKALDRAYATLQQPRSMWRVFQRDRARREIAAVARLQIDAALLYERVDNALKLHGDQYLARVHRAAGESYGFAEWHHSVQRKLETIERVHDKVHGEAADLRMETLEWIVILLIAGEILLSLSGIFSH
ncbi:MAG: hypothetical protein RL112_2618 [Planctomycetota bacterium]